MIKKVLSKVGLNMQTVAKKRAMCKDVVGWQAGEQAGEEKRPTVHLEFKLD